MNKERSKAVGLCEGRHDMPVDDFIFVGKIDPTNLNSIKKQAKDYVKNLPEGIDEIRVYVTGLTVAMLALVWACHEEKINLIAYHWDREGKKYIPQTVLNFNKEKGRFKVKNENIELI